MQTKYDLSFTRLVQFPHKEEVEEQKEEEQVEKTNPGKFHWALSACDKLYRVSFH